MCCYWRFVLLWAQNIAGLPWEVMFYPKVFSSVLIKFCSGVSLNCLHSDSALWLSYWLFLEKKSSFAHPKHYAYSFWVLTTLWVLLMDAQRPTAPAQKPTSWPSSQTIKDTMRTRLLTRSARSCVISNMLKFAHFIFRLHASLFEMLQNDNLFLCDLYFNYPKQWISQQVLFMSVVGCNNALCIWSCHDQKDEMSSSTLKEQREWW